MKSEQLNATGTKYDLPDTVLGNSLKNYSNSYEKHTILQKTETLSENMQAKGEHELHIMELF